ncbi:MAG: glycosyltransferase [Parcubacteria group bacterium]|nr:glycosyltransferase [Parcubacteria group bacterium]
MKFSIVTPVYNGEKFIAETIESVLSQEGDFEIEYIIMDGGSGDQTVEIIKKYDALLKEKKYPARCKKIMFSWLSEKDGGMYDAVNKGFARATGDIYAYLNADDTYLPDTFKVVSETFSKYGEIRWLKGINSVIDESSKTVKTNPCYMYNQEWIGMGVYGINAYFIHQESVFWRSELWKTAGGIDGKLKLAGDYYLWTQFAKFAPLWSISATLAGFRKRSGQKSEDMSGYRKEQFSVIQVPKNWLVFRIKLFFWTRSKLPTFFEPVFRFLYRVLFQKRNAYYIALKNGEPTKEQAYSFII